jgi:hypothetical protein
VPDIAVGARWAALGGYVKTFDGPTGAVIDRQAADADFEWLGSSVAITNGGASGLRRLAAGAYEGDSRSPNPGGYVRYRPHSQAKGAGARAASGARPFLRGPAPVVW